MNHVIESIGKWGVKTTPVQFRWDRPHPGDILQIPKELQTYPIDREYCRIESINKEEDTAHCINGMGSAFLFENGHISMSGGPFFTIDLKKLKPTYGFRTSTFWNWGDNSSGADQGVHYHIDRPVFLLEEHPNEFHNRKDTP